MKYLIVYGTTEGHTKKIAEFVSDHLRGQDHDVTQQDSFRKMRNIEVSDFDGVILAGSVHQEGHQEAFTSFAIAHREELEKLPTLLISVSLSAAFENGEVEAQKYVDKFIEYTQFEPKSVSKVAGALQYGKYDYYMEQILQHVVLEDHDVTNEDREYTDWDALRIAATEFSDSVLS